MTRADECEKQIEKSPEEKTVSPEAAVTEANAGKSDLAQDAKSYIEYLKNGGISGITGEFGKPEIFDWGDAQTLDVKRSEKNGVPLGDVQPQDVHVTSFRQGDGAPATQNGNRAETPSGQEVKSDRHDVPLGDVQPQDVHVTSFKQGDSTPSTQDVKPGDKTSVPTGDFQPSDAVDGTEAPMGLVGDRSRDSGVGSPSKPDVKLDDQGRLSEYKLPDGTKYEITYGSNGDPSKIVLTEENSQPITFEKNEKGDWVNPKNPEQVLAYVDKNEQGKIKMRSLDDEVTIGPDGSYKAVKWKNNETVAEIDKDGVSHKFDKTNQTETITKPGSHISEVKSTEPGHVGETKGYELRDDQNHVTKVDKNSDGTVTVTKGDQKETFNKVEQDSNGDLKFTAKDNSTLEMKQDGTEIRRDKNGHVTEITNSDSEVTKFARSADGKVAGVTVTDAQGHVVERKSGGIEINDQDATYTVREKDRIVERKADGTEQVKDKDGKAIESDQDKLLSKFKNYTPEQIHQLKQDLADIDKLPEAQRKKVYESLDKIARNDEHPEAAIHLTGQQSRELVASLAHQIAHPESIQQGDKMTCACANMEQTLAHNHPEVYADMVSKLATDGKYTTPESKPGAKDGITIEAQKTGEHDLAGKTDAYGQRTYSSELFQNAVAQLGMKDGAHYKSYAPGSPELEPVPNGIDPSRDTGERVVEANGDLKPFKGFNAGEQVDILNKLVPGDKFKETAPVNTPADLERAFQTNGRPPLNVGIHLGPESSFTDMPGSSGASGTGYHAVNVTKIATGPDGKRYVYYENPAGGADHSYPNGKGVPIDDFVKAMKGGNDKMKAVVRQGR